MTSKEKLGLFKEIKCKIQIDMKISSIDTFDKYLIFGDEKGNVACYELNESTNNCILDNAINLGKTKVDQIKCHPILNIVFILTGGLLYVLKIPKLEKRYTLEIKDITRFAINVLPTKSNEIVVTTKKKTLKFYEYNHEMSKLIPKFDDIAVKESPDFIEWYDNYLLIITISKKKSFLIKVNDGITKPLDDYEMKNVKNVDGSWLACIDDFGLFLKKKCDGYKEQNTINFGNKPLVCIDVFKNFIISLHDSEIKIFESKDSNHVEDYKFPFGSTGRFMSIGTRRIFYITQNFSETKKDIPSYDLYSLIELAFNLQIELLLVSEKIEDALNVFNNNIDSSDCDKPRKLEQLYLDIAWVYLKNGNFKEAKNYFKLTNFDSSALIYIFSKELKIKFNDKDLDTFLKSIKNYSIESITNNNSERIKEGLIILYSLLIDKMKFFTTSYKDRNFSGNLEKALLSNQKINFPSSTHSLINLDDFEKSFSEHLILINNTLIKIMIILKNRYKISDFKKLIFSNTFIWNKEELNLFLQETENKEEANLSLAYLFEKSDQWEKALKIWKEFGNLRESLPEFSLEAKERTIEILTLSKNKDLLTTYIDWMILKYPEDAFKLFIQTEILKIDFFYSLINTIDKENQGLNIKEKFLEFYIKNGCIEERYFIILCEIYIEKLFKLKKPSSDVDISSLEGNLKLNYEKLSNLIKLNNNFNKINILDKIKGSWLVDLEIFLYSKLSMHSEAILKLIQIGTQENDFTKVENYCNETESDGIDFFGEMFKTLSQLYKSGLQTLQTNKNENDKVIIEKNTNLYKKQILYLLKKNGDNNKLNIFLILEHIPGNWMLSEPSLYDFLVKIIKNNNHMSNKYKIARSLAEMNLLYKEKEVIEAKNKSIKIGNDTNCELCKKRIGSTIFVIYPNMKIYHTKCATNLNVCPNTRFDFSKNKQIY